MKRTIFRLPVVFLVVDSMVILLAWPGAFYLRLWLDSSLAAPVTVWQFIAIGAAQLPLWWLVLGSIGLYRRQVYQRRLLESGRLLLAAGLGVLLMIGVDFFLNQALLPGRLMALVGFSLVLVGLVVGRTLVRWLRRHLYQTGILSRRLAVIGLSPVTINLIEGLLEQPYQRDSGYKLVAVIGSGSELADRLRSNVDYYPEPTDIPWQKLSLDEVIIDDSQFEPAVSQSLVEQTLKNYLQLHMVPTDSYLLYASMSLDLFRQVPVLTINQTRLDGFGLLAKRFFDILVGSLIFIIVSPLLLLAMLAIKLTAPRDPVIFRHWRLSQFETNVPVYKLRTMHQRYSSQNPKVGLTALGRPDLARQTQNRGAQLDNDPRITRLGHWLRRYSIDELPQLINVIRGDISLVGPRALPRQELAGYEKYLPILMTVKTGLTGLAQVNGRSSLSRQQKIEVNIYYIKNWSLWLDFLIICKTVVWVLRQKNVNA